MDLEQAIKQATKKTKTRVSISWTRVAELMQDPNVSPDAYRCRYNRSIGKIKPRKRKENKKPKEPKDTKSTLIHELNKIRTVEELCKITGLNKIELLGHIEQLRIEGFDIIQHRVGNDIGYQNTKNPLITFNEFRHYHDIDDSFKIALISDTHIGSLYWQKSFLHLAYEDFQKEGITSVYHAGDISDGLYSNRAGNIYELYKIGFDEQLDEICNVFPVIDGITTFFITGNHDATHVMNGGANIGNAIAERRSDMKYLGHEYAKVWLTPKVDIDFLHPRDGSAYALSYKLQKRIDAISGGLKPKILAVGHYHKAFYMFYRNIHAYSLASMQAQSPFLRGKGIASDVGYLILEGKVNDKGDLIEVLSRFKPLYEPIIESFTGKSVSQGK